MVGGGGGGVVTSSKRGPVFSPVNTKHCMKIVGATNEPKTNHSQLLKDVFQLKFYLKVLKYFRLYIP